MLAERYPADSRARRRSKSRQRKTVNAGGSAKPKNANRPYTDAEKSRVAAAGHGDLPGLAIEMGHSYGGILKKHEELLKESRPPEPQPLTPEVHLADVPLSSSANPEIVEAAAASHEATASSEVAARDSGATRELAEFDGKLKRRPPAKPGIPVRGLTNDGPGKDRFMDPESWRSPGD
jgi:hypothetical protein